MSKLAKTVVAWNIQHGGGNGARQKRVMQQLLNFDADVLVLSEFRRGRSGDALCKFLHESGYQLSHPPAEMNQNTVLVASRTEILRAEPWWKDAPDLRHLWFVETSGIRLCAVYMPLNKGKFPYWNALLSPSADAPALDLVVGDFNTGDNTLDREPHSSPYTAARMFTDFASGAFIDLWRSRFPDTREYTWFSGRGKNGFRLDHAFGSIAFSQRVATCGYLPEPRLAGNSDHSAMRLEILDKQFAVPSASGRPIQTKETAELNSGGVIYAFQDPACPDLIKIGKDTKWPQRLRQAQSHTPRTINVVGVWTAAGDRSTLAALEKEVLAAFQRHNHSSGREWRIAPGNTAAERISKVVGSRPRQADEIKLKPFDDWRDYSKPTRSEKLRRLWIGREKFTSRLKIVHSPHIERFADFCPTYSCFGIDWLHAWVATHTVWEQSQQLNKHDQIVVAGWHAVVEQFGYGSDDPRVGWLREDIALGDVFSKLAELGLTRDEAVWAGAASARKKESRFRAAELSQLRTP